MEYLDILKGLSSQDPLARISTIARIIHVIKSEKSSVLVNTMAISMSVQFSCSTNRERYFICLMFSECAEEMCMIKNKIDVLRNLASVLDFNDPIAICLAIRILGFLAPLLPEFLEIHHKLLLTLQSPHRKVRNTTSLLLPRLMPFAPTIAKYVFDAPLSQIALIPILRALPSDQLTINKAYSYVQNFLPEEKKVEALTVLTLKCKSLLPTVKHYFLMEENVEYLRIILKKYRIKQFLGMEPVLTGVEDEVSELLTRKTLVESDYKFIFQNWKPSFCPSGIVNRLYSLPAESPETSFCVKLCRLLFIQIEINSGISLETAYYLISQNQTGSVLQSLNYFDEFELYKIGCFLLKQGRPRQALPIFIKIKAEFKGNDERIYE